MRPGEAGEASGEAIEGEARLGKRLDSRSHLALLWGVESPDVVIDIVSAYFH